MRTSTMSTFLPALVLAFAALWTQCVLAGTTEQAQPAVARIEGLQSQVRQLMGQLDEIEEMHSDAERRALVERHWRGMQDYMRSLRRLLPPAPAGSPGSLAVFGSAAGCRLAATMDPGAYVSRTRELLWTLREQLATIRQTADPAQRLGRLAHHAVDAYHGLQLIRGYGWMYGAAAPVEMKDQPVPDSASTSAYLVHRYCGQCHAPPPPELHSANEWSGTATKMVAHMGVAESGNPQEIEVPKPQEMSVILSYLEANGCEIDQ